MKTMLVEKIASTYDFLFLFLVLLCVGEPSTIVQHPGASPSLFSPVLSRPKVGPQASPLYRNSQSGRPLHQNRPRIVDSRNGGPGSVGYPC